MIKFLRLARFEVGKLWRMRLARALFALLVMETVGKAMVIHFQGGEMLAALARGVEPDGPGTLAALMLTSLNMVNLLSLVFASLLVAGETSSGALRLVSSMPFSRSQIIASKFAALLLFVSAGVLTTGALNWLLCEGLVGVGAVAELDYVVYSASEVAANYWKLHLMAIPAIFAVACFGLLVSTWSASSGGAVAATLLLFFSLSVYENLKAEWLFFLQMRYAFSNVFLDMAQGIGVDVWNAQTAKALKYAFGYMAIFGGGAVGTFVWRENYS